MIRKPATPDGRSDLNVLHPGSLAHAEHGFAMTEGEGETQRRCIATGEVRPREGLLRFVHAPDGRVVFDVSGKLPGRGYWLVPSRELLLAAIKRRAFSHKAAGKTLVPDDLPDQVRVALEKQVLGGLGLARKSGELVVGFDKVHKALRAGELAILFCAADAAEDSVRKMGAIPEGVTYADCFGREALSAAVGENNLVHLGVKSAIVARKLRQSVQRYLDFVGSNERERMGSSHL